MTKLPLWPNTTKTAKWWCCVQSAPCTRRRGVQVSWFSLKTKVDGFFWFGLKTGGYNSCGLASTTRSGFPVWASKPVGAVWWFVPQNHHNSFLVLALKPSGSKFVCLHLQTDEQMKMVWGHTLTSGGLLCHEGSQARVSQFCLKIGEGVIAGGALGIIMKVAWKWS
jgi:hypothetical protein